MSVITERGVGDLRLQGGDELLADQLHAMKERMEVLYSQNFDKLQGTVASPPEAVDYGRFFQPPVDLWETETEWLILVDLPGVGEEDFRVELIENHLTIQGHRRHPPLQEGKAAVICERPEGSFSRTFVLPSETQAEAITAELKQGVLTVAIAKSGGLTIVPHQVQVKPG